MTKHVALTAAILYSSLFLVPSAMACQCLAVDSSPCASAKRGDLMFVGTVLTEEPIVMDSGAPRIPHEPGRRLGLSVQETLVGTARKFVHVETSNSSCGFPFEVGEQYLVYSISRATERTRIPSHVALVFIPAESPSGSARDIPPAVDVSRPRQL